MKIIKSNKKLLIISGPTATGKTKLALRLAYALGGEIVSADSRHTYKGLDVLTGKDIPGDFRMVDSQLVYENEIIRFFANGTKIWLVDVFDRAQRRSVYEYQRVARLVCSDLWKRGKLPIVTGGTGFYIKTFIDPPDSLSTMPDPQLRDHLEKHSVLQLQRMLLKVSPQRYNRMNHSDLWNTRRLVRAIEVARRRQPAITIPKLDVDILWIGLQAPVQFLEQQLKMRIDYRIAHGVVGEVHKELQSKVSGIQSEQAIGFDVIANVVYGSMSLDEAKERWLQVERQYMKRQLTWLKKEKRIVWFDISVPNYPQDVERFITSWYTYSNDESGKN